MTLIPHISQYQFKDSGFVLRNKTHIIYTILLALVLFFPKTVTPVLHHENNFETSQSTVEVEEDKASRYIMSLNKSLSLNQATELVSHIREYSETFNLDYRLVLALIKVESTFDPDASNKGAKGLTQVVPYWHKDKIEDARYRLKVYSIFEPKLNIYVGSWILRECINRAGNLHGALVKYNASDTANEYADKVLKEYHSLVKKEI